MAQNWTDDVFDPGHVGQTDLQNIENNFACLKSSFSGSSAPANPVPGMFWVDTANHILKMRNEANNAWLNVWDLANDKPYGQDFTDGSYLDGDKVDIDFDPSSYSPDSAIAEADDDDDLSAHLKGIDQVLANVGIPNNSSVGQAQLKTSVGSVSLTGSSNTQIFTLPGGQYGFYPQIRFTNSTSSQYVYVGSILGRNDYNNGWIRNNEGLISSSYDSGYGNYITLSKDADYNVDYVTVYAQQRYITSSGEVHWIFLMKDKQSGDVLSMWQAPDHPCFGNGGKPILVPHPFGNYDQEKHEIIVINPPLEEVKAILNECERPDDEHDKDFLQVIREHYRIDESSSPPWPEQPITVGLPKKVNGKRVDDWRFIPHYDSDGSPKKITPIKKKIPQMFKTARLKLKA